MPRHAPGQSLQERYVFVYGTLRRSGSNDINLRSPAPRYVGTARVRGKLFDLGFYPGLMLSSAGEDFDGAVMVVGEVYAISPALESNLDELEGLLPVNTGEYFKRFLTLQVQTAASAASGTDVFASQELLCIVYEINPLRTKSFPSIASGDWITHRVQKDACPSRVSIKAQIPQGNNSLS